MWKILILFLLFGDALGEATTENYVDSSTLPPDAPESNNIQNNQTQRPAFRLPEDLYIKAFTYLKGSKAFRHFTFEQARQFLDDIDAWEAPPELNQDFPYYLSGYDYDDHPIWILEFGKYDPRKYVNQGPEGEALMTKYAFQGALRLLRSTQARETSEKEIRDVILIVDAEGLDLTIVTHPASIAFALKLGHAYRDIVEKALASIVLVNANYATRVAIDIARPIAGRIMERMEVFGSIKSKYKAELRRRFPPTSIPPWYGGDEGFKPLEVYG